MKHLRLTALLIMIAASQLAAETLVTDSFDYPDGPIVTNSPGLWNNHSGSADQFDVAGGKANLTFSESEDINRSIGAAYSTGNLFYAVTVNFSNSPSTFGSYFAHFKDTDSGAQIDNLARLYSRLTGEGTIEFSVGNRSDAPATFASETFELFEDILLVVGIDLDNQITSLWINPSDPLALPVIQDTTAYTLAGADTAMSAIALRQAGGIGTFTLDNLIVGTTFASVIPEPSTWLLILSAGMLVLFLRKRKSLS